MSLNLNAVDTPLQIEVNGEPRTLPSEATVRDVLTRLGIDPEADGIAVARNLRIVRRDAWAQTTLEPGDRLEVVTATQGG